MTAREYRLVLGEIAAALFACPDCGAVVWYSLREAHDAFHQRAADQAEQTAALITTTFQHTDLLDVDERRLDEHAEQIVALQERAR